VEEEGASVRFPPDKASSSYATPEATCPNAQLLLEPGKQPIAFRQTRRQMIIVIVFVIPLPHFPAIMFAVILPIPIIVVAVMVAVTTAVSIATSDASHGHAEK